MSNRKPPKPFVLGNAEAIAMTEGRAHFRYGFKISDNPYNDDTVKRAAWRLGWLKERDGK